MASQDLALLVLRLSGIYLAWGHGVGKIQRLLAGEGGGFIDAVGNLGFPVPTIFAWLSAIGETAGFLVALGLLTRVSAVLGGGSVLVAAFLRHKAHLQFLGAVGLKEIPPETLKGWGSAELALLYLLCMITIVILGPGRYSLDALVWRRRGAAK